MIRTIVTWHIQDYAMVKEPWSASTVQSLQLLLAKRDHAEFLTAFENSHTPGNDFLEALGGEGLCLFLQESSAQNHELALRYERLLLGRSIVAPQKAILQLATILQSQVLVKLVKTMSARHAPQKKGDERQYSRPTQQTVLNVRRVVQTMQMYMGDGRFSDSSEIRTSVFRSQQERTFLRALSLRFPGLLALPNYPLDQIVALDRVGAIDAKTLRYGRICRLDAVLVVPDEGDPVAVFELDSVYHDRPKEKHRDSVKNSLIAASGLPFFRLRPESPESMSIDEWYALLSDEILPHIDLGNRVRCRDAAYRLIPC